jgi:hypothetical protein
MDYVVRIARPWRFASDVGFGEATMATQLLMPVYHEQQFHCIPDERRATNPAVVPGAREIQAQSWLGLRCASAAVSQ